MSARSRELTRLRLDPFVSHLRGAAAAPSYTTELSPRTFWNFAREFSSFGWQGRRREVFFSILGKQGLSHRVDRSKASLRAFLLQYLEQYNQTSAPFKWTKGPEKLQRIIEATKAAHHNGQLPKRRRKRAR